MDARRVLAATPAPQPATPLDVPPGAVLVTEELLAEAMMRADQANDWLVDQIGSMHGGPHDRSRLEVAAAIMAALREPE